MPSSTHTLFRILVMALLALASAPLHSIEARAQGSDKTSKTTEEDTAEEEEDGEEDGEEEEAEGSVVEKGENFEEMEALSKLEERSLAPIILGEGNAWKPELLAPYTGAMASMRRDAGLIHELRGLPTAAPRGSDLCNITSVRERFDRTEVLGQRVRYDHPSVRAYLDFFDGRGKPTLTRWIRRMRRYEPMILEVLREEGLPDDLIYVAMIESGFSTTARSPASAVGMWQFIETTGSEMGLRIDGHVDERRDPIKATRAAAKYLKRLHERYDSWPLALAAYNGGPGLVDREIRRYNTNDYWVIVRQRGMYDETRRYVPKAITAALVSKNLDIFGLDGSPDEEAWDFDLVEIESPTRLSIIASAIGTSVDTLRDLNPELKVAATPPVGKGKTYALRIPSGKSKAFVASFDKIKVSEGGFDLHEVQIGEGLSLLAAHYGIKPRVLRAVNGLGRRERISYGKTLVIPKEGRGSWSPSKSSKDKPIVFVPSLEFSYEDRTRYVYEINAGDSLDVLGMAFGVNPADIAIWNALDVGAKLRTGMYLQFYLPKEREPEGLALQPADNYQLIAYGSQEYEAMMAKKKRSSGSSRRYHKVRPGESLWLIARRYKTTVTKLRKLNPKLRRSNTLQPGEKIRVR